VSRYTLKLDMTVPLDNDAGTVRLIFELPDYGATSESDAAILANVSTEFFAWLVQKFVPQKETAKVESQL
jgi:hypothetical protein